MVTFFPSNPNIARSIGAYNDNLARAELGRMQEAVALTEAKLRADAQREALRQSYFQNQQANQLEQQRLNQMGQYQQGQLTNQREATAAQMEWQKALAAATASESDKDRASREKIAQLGVTPKTDAIKAQEQDVQFGSQSLAEQVNAFEELQKKVNAITTAATEAKSVDLPGWDRWYGDTRRKQYFNSRSPVKLNDALPFDVGMQSVATGLSQQLAGMKAEVDRLQGLYGNYVTRGPDGKMISRLAKTPTPAATPTGQRPFFPQPESRPPIGVVPMPSGEYPVNGPQSFFVPQSAPQTTTSVPGRTITVRTSDGRVLSGPESQWPKLKAQDPGAEIVSSDPVPQFTNPGGAPGSAMMMRQFFTQ